MSQIKSETPDLVEKRNKAGFEIKEMQNANDVRTDAAGLETRVDVKVVQVKAMVGGTECVEANALGVEDDELSMFGIERIAETLARTLWVEPTDTLQTVPHRGDAKGHKLVEIGSRDG